MKRLIVVVLAVSACACFYRLRRPRNSYSAGVWVAYAGIFASAAALFIAKAIAALTQPQIFDFTAFYLYGKAGVSGNDFYSPAALHRVYSTLALPPNNYDLFVHEIVNVGFLYPPPTILLFSPLGFLSFQSALSVWTAFNLFFALGCILLTYDLFLRKYEVNGFVLAATLFLLLPSARETVSYSQTNFILLFLLLLMFRSSRRPIAGVLLAMAVLVKPYMIVFGVALLLLRNWKAITAAAASGIALAATTWAIFGKTPFSSYLFDNPSTRLPSVAFFENVNQSLQSVLLRAGVLTMTRPIVYVGLAVILFASTLAILEWLVRRRFYDCMWALLLLSGLILYPGTLSHYGVLLAFILFQFFDEQRELGFGPAGAIALVGAAFLLQATSLFACLCFLLAVVLWKARRVASLQTSLG